MKALIAKAEVKRQCHTHPTNKMVTVANDLIIANCAIVIVVYDDITNTVILLD